jgi:pimeloyl-ACP methyl ester carboxylesterase
MVGEREVTAPRSRRIALATGLTYHLLEWGDPGAPPVVLVHGFLDVAWTWDAVARRLAADHRVIAPDLRGHGDSDWIGAGGYYHFMDYVADLDDVIARVGAPVALVGHSMGGSVASYYAGARPERVGRLALLEGQGPPDQVWPLPDRTARWIDACRAVRTGAPAAMASVAVAAARIQRHDRHLGDALALALAERGTRPVAGGVAWKHDPLHLTMGPYPFRLDAAEQFWRRVACPVLCLDGAESNLRLPDAEAARRRAVFADCRHAIVPSAGHTLQRHQPELVAQLLADFLGVDRPASA